MRFLIIFMLIPFCIFSETVEEIVNKANDVAYYQGEDGKANVAMSIFNSKGQKRERKMVILRKDAQKDQKFYVFFKYPSDVSKMSFLVWKQIAKEDDRWLYLPALDLVKRISSADKRTSFAGSHYFYEDVSGRNINDDKHELLESNENFYVIKNTPKNQSSVEFSYYKMWILKKNYLVSQVVYYDKNGKEYRKYNLLKWDMIQGFPTPTKSVMKDLRTDGYTETEYSGIKYNLNIPENIFTERFLRRAPYKYLK